MKNPNNPNRPTQNITITNTTKSAQQLAAFQATKPQKAQAKGSIPPRHMKFHGEKFRNQQLDRPL